ncbi:gag protein [Wolbachia endosymbiont of Drosophila ananassae]|nr:gag protein [Wolbachia endosymbiont of Drosophila ananassae]
MTDSNGPSTSHSANLSRQTPEQTLTSDLIVRLIANNLTPLHEEIKTLRSLLDSKSNLVTEFQIEQIDDTIPCDETLEIVKSVPQFSGNLDNYVAWREAAETAMGLYVRKSRRYFVALTILRNKIVGKANDALTNHGTVLNFDAILARLDFVFSDKRPIHIIEQELSVLTQNRFSVMDFYNLVNKKLTLLINKTIMTYGKENPITTEANLRHRQNALRVFITGLNGPISGMLFSLNPPDLPNALARVQEMESNHMRAQFAYRFSAPQRRYNDNQRNQNEPYYRSDGQNQGNQLRLNRTNDNYKNYNGQNPNYQHNNRSSPQNNNNSQNKNNPQNSNSYQNHNSYQHNNTRYNPYPSYNTWTQRNNTYQNRSEPMEVDSSIQIQNKNSNQVFPNGEQYQTTNSLQYNSFQQPEQAVKRAQIESSAQPRNKQMRINNIKEEHFLGEE